MNSSIFRRIFKNNLFIVLMVFIVMSLIYVLAMERDMMNIKYSQIGKVINDIDHTIFYTKITESKRRNYEERLNQIARVIDAEIVILDTKGKILVDTPHDINTVSIVEADDFAENTELVLSGKSVHKRGGLFSYDSKAVVAEPITYNGIILGGCIIGADLRNMSGMKNDVVLLIIICAAITMFVAAIMVYLQSKELSRPIIILNSAAKDISNGVYTKINISEKGEIGELITSFNSMTKSLERLEEMRSSFVSDVSHELRTPITSISGFIQGMLDGVIPPEKYEKYLTIVLAEVKRLSRLINDMLDSTKYANGVYEFKMKKFDINKLISDVLDQIENKLEEKELEAEFTFEYKEMFVEADMDSIQRVLINLLDNAVKFSNKNTVLIIDTNYENNKVVVSIGNYGEGIDEKDIDSIFDRFYKADKSRANSGGSGIGLYLTNSIIKGHNENITVESCAISEDVKYTVFRFTLSASDER